MKEFDAIRGSLPSRGLTVAGIIVPTEQDDQIFRIHFTNRECQVVTGALVISIPLLTGLYPTGRKIWFQGLVHDEYNVKFKNEAQIPAEAAITFIKGMLDTYATPSITKGAPIVGQTEQGGIAIPHPACYYEGCGGPDGWPRMA